MSQKKPISIMSYIFLVFFALGTSPLAQPDLQYQKRNDHYEGVKPKPVSGYDIELISVLVDFREEIKDMPDRFKVRFYLNRRSEVYLTVRELDYKYYYWLDKVKPLHPWDTGFDNVFEWGTKDVIKQLEGIRMFDLGVLIRLENPAPSSVESVAPALLYHSDAPEQISGYLFTFKTSGYARVSCSLYKNGEAKPEWTRTFRRKPGGRPFTVRWNTSEVEEGAYKLLVTGYFLDTNRKFHQSVRFYHQPRVR